MNYMGDRSVEGEFAAPQCNLLGSKYRRVLDAAIINCGSITEAMTSDTRNIPVAGFGKFFLTLPAASGAGLYAEFLGLIEPTDTVNHDMVQLYR